MGISDDDHGWACDSLMQDGCYRAWNLG